MSNSVECGNIKEITPSHRNDDNSGSYQLADVIIVSTSFPSHKEIVLPADDISVDTPESPKGEVKEQKYSQKKRDGTKSLSDDSSPYTEIGVHADHSGHETNKPTSPKSPKSPTSIYTIGGSLKKPKLELKQMDVSTRQCKFEIGEEVERFQGTQTNKSPSAPPSPITQQKHEKTLESHVNAGYAPSQPAEETPADLDLEKATDPFPFHFLFTTTPNAVLKQHQIVPNPFNKINHRFHSTLQCPCFLFFFFLCCLPAVHLMQKSDSAFKKGYNLNAKKFGRLSTLFFVVGSIIGVAFLSVAIYFAADYVRQFV